MSLRITQIFLLLLLCASTSSLAQTSQEKLIQGDSLYLGGSYSQALSVYQDLYHTEQVYTPAMLLRMAHMYDLKRDFARAQYFLNTYFIQTGDRSVFEKITEIAETNSLEGYERSDTAYFFSLIYAYLPTVTTSIVILVAALLIWMSYRQAVKKQRVRITPWAVLVLALVYFGITNTNYFDTAIIKRDQTFLMQDASSASSIMEVLSRGHKITLIEKEDVWWKVRWGSDKEGYVREAQIMTLGDNSLN